jgi:methylase of polypeptide subunit release factors
MSPSASSNPEDTLGAPLSGWPRTEERAALVELGLALRQEGYHFVTPTPETHRRVVSRTGREQARDLRDVFGWSLPFRPDVLGSRMRGALERAGAAADAGAGLLRARVRWSTLDGDLFVHSAYPTTDSASVFFGPDTYRFVGMLRRAVTAPVQRVVDVGCGSGAGGLCLRGLAERVVLADINPVALALATVNAELAGATHRVEVIESDVLSAVQGRFDLVISNPPYLVDDDARVYRDGGGGLGSALSARIAAEALARLPPGGRLLLYTGSAVVGGEHVLRRLLRPACEDAASVRYQELDPDVFGEELARPAYDEVERLAVVEVDAVRR